MENNEDRSTLIRNALKSLNPSTLTISDESEEHIGHSSARGAGHFAIQIVSDAFEGKTAVQRHQMIYEALGDLMTTEIHAIRIDAKAPE